MNSTLNRSNYDKYIEIYNQQGRVAGKNYVINECGTDYATFQRRMRKESPYTFNRSTRKFEEQGSEGQFMSLEDLCKAKNSAANEKSVPLTTVTRDVFDELVVSLMRDRLIEMHYFIRFEQHSKQIVVNSKMIKDSGYFLTII